ncbi:exonuclease domain-containing protein [Robiginitalea aurantiaca]|uniref:Exonuclease domain-containing protein n=1 Tax=Robiginitalea aurantiaca TaxID=3056915 RepID=A0ABT7WG92_9FLAO|nr:exonuclease domain-containing protein [Robiginitalea aurantiaca]MDM9631936.1 exonuclease domain-containing protein [Robiginitalea aurantiaca]
MYAILDIETTGGKYNEEAITEIAIHRFDGDQVVDTFISLINPEREIQPYVQKLTGIYPKMVRTAPKFYQVAKRIVEITEGTVLVAHNAMFDYRILRTEFRRLGFDFQRQTLCTVALSQQLIPEAESHSLGKLVRSLGIPVSDRHRANGDALATLKLFQVLMNRDIKKGILREVIRAEEHGELSSRQLKLVASVPRDIGVYYLFNKEGALIYLGNSRNMQAAVNAHFTGEHQPGLSLRKETREVQFERTGSELMALLKTHMELVTNQPVHNQPLRSAVKPERNQIQVNGTPMSLEGRQLLLVDKGRKNGERSAIWLQDKEVKGIGYYELNHQINNIHILENLLTPVSDSTGALDVVIDFLNKKPILKAIEL